MKHRAKPEKKRQRELFDDPFEHIHLTNSWSCYDPPQEIDPEEFKAAYQSLLSDKKSDK